jgi:hypothetical protein
MAENELIAAVEAYLGQRALLPAPKSIGVGEPIDATALPALVISLEDTRPIGEGIGKRSALITHGHLAWQATINLASPLLPGDPTFRLLDDARTQLVLPHGGLVRNDGSSGTFADADLSVTVDGTPRKLSANDFTVDPTPGILTFAAALPASGTLVAKYFLGQWEQSLERIAGTLRIDVCAATVDDARALSEAVVIALADPAARSAIVRLLVVSPLSVSSVGAREPDFANARRRTLRFRFDFENEVNQPESSGWLIEKIPIVTQFAT